MMTACPEGRPDSAWNGRLPSSRIFVDHSLERRMEPTYGRKEPAVSSIAHRGFVHVGMDVSKDSIAVAVLPPDRDVAEIDKIFNDEDSVRRLIKRLGKPKGMWACYEAGPTGYDLQRLLTSMGVRCDVVAPSLVPKGSGDRVKTDRRDARRLAGLHRAGELTPVAIPTPAQEACAICAAPAATWSRISPGPATASRVLAASQGHVAGWLDVDRRPTALAGDLVLRGPRTGDDLCPLPRDRASARHLTRGGRGRSRTVVHQEPFGDQVTRLAAYRGVTRIGALCLGAEVFDWRRFPRARPFMSFTGLVPGEHSTG